MCQCGKQHKRRKHPQRVGLIEQAIRDSLPDFTPAEAMTFHSTCTAESSLGHDIPFRSKCYTDKVLNEQHKPQSPDDRL